MGCLLVLIAFGTMTVMNGVMAIPAMVGSHEVRREFAEGREPDEFDLSGVRFTKDDRPNVYCFLFDEYGGYENLLDVLQHPCDSLVAIQERDDRV